jgi:putative oxidoreductase
MLLNLLTWAIIFYLIYVFGKAGYAKITNDPMMVGAFNMIPPVPGFDNDSFRKFTGGIELLSCVFLVVPPLAAFGGLLLTCTMIGALLTHWLVFKGGYEKPAVLLVLSLIVTVLTW